MGVFLWRNWRGRGDLATHGFRASSCSQRAFFGVSALLFAAASAAVTIV
jgi:hypothetical protein